MSKYSDAIRAQSASNPVGLTNSLYQWQCDMLKAGASTQEIASCPAIRLLAYQISCLLSIENMSDNLYATLTQKCEDLHKAL